MATVEVVGLAEASEVLGLSRQNFNLHRKRYSEEGQCPAPTADLRCGPVWVGSDKKALDKWAQKYAKIRDDREKAKERRANAVKKAVKPAAKAAKKIAPAKKTAKKGAVAKKVAPVAKKTAPAKAVAPLAKKVAAAAKKTVAEKKVFGAKQVA